MNEQTLEPEDAQHRLDSAVLEYLYHESEENKAAIDVWIINFINSYLETNWYDREYGYPEVFNLVKDTIGGLKTIKEFGIYDLDTIGLGDEYLWNVVYHHIPIGNG